MLTTITDLGIAAALQAGLGGPEIRVNKVKIGSAIIQPNSSMTDVVDPVWEGNVDYIRYQVQDQRTFTFVVSLDEEIGDFDIGNIGLFLDDGTMFSITTMVGKERKIANNPPQVGNRITLAVPIVLTGISGLIDLTIMVPDENSIPFLQTEAGLPPANTAPFSVYEIIYHTELKSRCLALRGPDGWQFVTAGSADQAGSFDPEMFATDVKVGELVYYNPSTNLFEKANGLDDSKGYLGIKTSNYNVVSSGIYVNGDWDLTPGVNYYADGAPYEGKLTSVANGWYVGMATAKNTLMLGRINETTLNKTDSINTQNPSKDKYPSEWAIVNSLNGWFAKVDMSNVGDATFKGKITFNQVIQGTAYRALWGDICEFNSADKYYEAGTLLQFGGNNEFTIAKDKVNAVVTNVDTAGFILNNAENLENPTPIALMGRVLVNVEGEIKKFDRLYLSKESEGKASNVPNGEAIGTAIADSKDGKVLANIRALF